MKKRSAVRSNLLPAMSSYARHFFIIAFIALGILSFFTIKPFLSAIVLGGVVAYTFFPAFKVILKYINHRKISALVLSTLLVLAIVIPVFMTASFIYLESLRYLKSYQKSIFYLFMRYKAMPLMKRKI